MMTPRLSQTKCLTNSIIGHMTGPEFGPLSPEMRAEQVPQPPQLSDHEVVDAYQKAQRTETGLEEAGQAVMSRLLEKIERPETDAERLLPTLRHPETGEHLKAKDYLLAADRHPGAKRMILDFVRLRPNHPKYPAIKEAVSTVVDGHLPPREPQD